MVHALRRVNYGQETKGLHMINKKLARVQCVGVLAIMGSLCTSPTDALDVLSNPIPFALTIEKWCFSIDHSPKFAWLE